MKLMLIILYILIAVIVITFLGFEVRSWQVNRDARNKIFAAGTVPAPLPDGFFKGHVNGYRGTWIGKTFDASGNGINNFSDGNKLYPFKFYPGPGLTDKSLTVLKIDYNQQQNSWWVRHIVDEVVQTAPGQLLGKIQARWLGLTFSIGYFTLQK